MIHGPQALSLKFLAPLEMVQAGPMLIGCWAQECLQLDLFSASGLSCHCKPNNMSACSQASLLHDLIENIFILNTVWFLPVYSAGVLGGHLVTDFADGSNVREIWKFFFR